MRRLILMVLALLLCVSLSACGSQPSLSQTPAPSDTEVPTQTPASLPAAAEPQPPLEEPASPSEPEESDVPEKARNGKILLYGEFHGNQLHYERELALWSECYGEGMLDLILETPCYTAEYLNRWLRAESDEILDRLFLDYQGTLWDTPSHRAFFQAIKETCPETVFHGVDVGMNTDRGWRYIHLLEAEGLRDDPSYTRARECLAQGRTYSSKTVSYAGAQYRDDCLAENFAAVFDNLNGRDVMGIFGCFHINGDDSARPSPEYATMLDQLLRRYPEAIEIKTFPPVMETLTAAGREYSAEYGGMTASYRTGYAPRRFWKLADAYEDFKNCPLTGEYFLSLPFPEEIGQVYVIERQLEDGTVSVRYYRSDGSWMEGYWMAEEFLPE